MSNIFTKKEGITITNSSHIFTTESPVYISAVNMKYLRDKFYSRDIKNESNMNHVIQSKVKVLDPRLEKLLHILVVHPSPPRIGCKQH